MPDVIAPVQVPDVDLDQKPFVFGDVPVSDALALTLVNKTFSVYETFRSQNHDRRWNAHDALYFGWVPPRTWDGTSVPRASLGMPIVFDQLEAALPPITEALFGGDEWFQVVSEFESSPEEARIIQDKMRFDFEHSKDEYGSTARQEILLAIKSMLLYGNGGVGYEWDQEKKRVKVSWVDIRDFYIDPALTVPSVNEARSIIRRKMMTVQELEKMKDYPGMKIPESGILNYFSLNFSNSFGDNTKRIQEALRGVNYQPGSSDYMPNPADRQIEVHVYYSKSRIIWVIGRQLVIYNEPNPYGFIPFDFAPCYIVPGRFYAQSFGDVQEGNQRYSEALLNARLDEVHLALHPPRVTKRSTLMTPAQQRWRPGAIFMSDDPKDMTMLQPQNVTQNIYTELEYIQQLSEKRTGVNSMGMGVPRGGNVNRTATGVQAQMSGGASRLQALVKNIEDYMIVPMLYKAHRMINVHTALTDTLPATDKDGKFYRVEALKMRKPMQFTMVASSKMMTRDKLMQIFPFLTQYLLNGAFLSELQKVGKTVDFGEFTNMLIDATGTAQRYRLIREMSPQELQAKNAPPPEAAAKQQELQQEGQLRMQLAQLDSQTELQKAQIAKQPDAAELQKAEAEKQKAAVELQMQQQEAALKLQVEQMMAKVKMMAAQADHDMKMQHKQQDMQLKQVEMQQKGQLAQQDAQIKMQQTAQEGELQRQNMAQQTQLDLEAKRANMQLDNEAAQNQAKITARAPRPEEPRKRAEKREKTTSVRPKP